MPTAVCCCAVTAPLRCGSHHRSPPPVLRPPSVLIKGPHMDTSLSTVFWSEVFGTGFLTLLGCGVVANVALARNKGLGGGFLMVNFGWGLAVFAGVYVAFRSGAHLNPAVTLGLLANDAGAYAPGVDIT